MTAARPRFCAIAGMPTTFAVVAAVVSIIVSEARAADEPIDIGSRRELFVDHALLDKVDGLIALELHQPTAREIAIQFDAPWEGNASGYPTVFKDGDIFRMYYRGHRYLVDDQPLRQAQAEVVCYAESKDGIHWTKPNLRLVDWPGLVDPKANNIIWLGGPETHNFAPFKDENPKALPDECYKAVGGTVTSKGLLTFKSADGIHWSKMSDGPVVSKGAFDSHNTVFWHPETERYSMYVRYFSEDQFKGLRAIGKSQSPDFKNWSEPVGVTYGKSPPQQMYTNQIAPYHRAPHVLFGFPTRYVARPQTKHLQKLAPVDVRTKLLKADERSGTDLTDGVFMTSRDGITFHRWDEAFLRPGSEAEGRWLYGDNYQSYGLWETASAIPGAPAEISLHFNEGAWRDESSRLRRYTIRLDGFASAHALYGGGEIITKPITFEGTRLSLNYATSAAGSLRIEIQDADGKPIPGFSLEESDELFGDSVDQTAAWKNGSDVSSLAGKSVRLRFALRDGDLYSYQFTK